MLEERLSDVFSALAFLAAQPSIDGNKVILHGHSYGGTTVGGALTATDPTGNNGEFVAGIAYYPNCAYFSARLLKAPLLPALSVAVSSADAADARSITGAALAVAAASRRAPWKSLALIRITRLLLPGTRRLGASLLSRPRRFHKSGHPPALGVGVVWWAARCVPRSAHPGAASGAR